MQNQNFQLRRDVMKLKMELGRGYFDNDLMNNILDNLRTTETLSNFEKLVVFDMVRIMVENEVHLEKVPVIMSIAAIRFPDAYVTVFKGLDRKQRKRLFGILTTKDVIE